MIKCTVKTINGLIIECVLSHDTIRELKTVYNVSVRNKNK